MYILNHTEILTTHHHSHMRKDHINQLYQRTRHRQILEIHAILIVCKDHLILKVLDSAVTLRYLVLHFEAGEFEDETWGVVSEDAEDTGEVDNETLDVEELSVLGVDGIRGWFEDDDHCHW